MPGEASAKPQPAPEAPKVVNWGIPAYKAGTGPNGGWIIAKVDKFGSAGKGGLIEGDEIVAVDGSNSMLQGDTSEKFDAYLAKVGVGGTVKATVVRAGKRLDVSLKLFEKKKLNLDLDEFDSVLERKIAPAA